MFALPPFVSREKNGVHGVTIGFSASFYPQYGWMDGRGLSCLGAQLCLSWRYTGSRSKASYKHRSFRTREISSVIVAIVYEIGKHGLDI